MAGCVPWQGARREAINHLSILIISWKIGVRLTVPPGKIRDLYGVAVEGPRDTRRSRAQARFLDALGLLGYRGSEVEFRMDLAERLLDGLGIAGILDSVEEPLTHIALSRAAAERGMELSKTSASRLLLLLEELGVVTRVSPWRVYTPSTRDAVIAYLRARGEARLGELEDRFGDDTREAVLGLYGEGLVDIRGSPRGPAPGPLGVPRELVAGYGVEIPAEEVESRGLVGARLRRVVDRNTGRIRYAVILRRDDVVVWSV